MRLQLSRAVVLLCALSYAEADTSVLEVLMKKVSSLEAAIQEIPSLKADLKFVSSRLAALEESCLRQRTSGDPADGRRILLGETSGGRHTSIDENSVRTNIINVTTLVITGSITVVNGATMVWHDIPVGFNAPTLSPTPSPTYEPTFEPTVAYSSCKQYLTANPSLTNGVYQLWNNGAVYSAYCDMVNGGWELVMRVKSSSSEFIFSSGYWTNTAVFGTTSDMDPLSDSDAKFTGYMKSPLSKIRGCLRGVSAPNCKSYSLSGYSTLQNVFATVPVSSAGHAFIESQAQMFEWLTISGFSCSDASTCTWAMSGINLVDDLSCYDAGVRFGIMINNKDSISDTNDAVGFGAQDAANCGTGASAGRIGAGLAVYADQGLSKKGSIWIQGP
jgi:hypothetical protein